MELKIKNPHSVLAALQARPKDVKSILLSSNEVSEGWDEVAQVAKRQGVSIRTAGGPSRPAAKGSDGRVSLAEASILEKESVSLEELFSPEDVKASPQGLWLALDSLQDPHNVGAIFRTAAFFGVRGILLTAERSAPLTSTVYDVASGGMEYVPFSVQTNLQRAFKYAKDAGLWILGSSEHAQQELTSLSTDRAWLLVIGSEEKGMRRLTEENCDLVCKIPCRGEVTSLNASVAAGVLIAHLSEPKSQSPEPSSPIFSS